MSDKKNAPTPPAPKPIERPRHHDFIEQRPANTTRKGTDGVTLTNKPPPKPGSK